MDNDDLPVGKVLSRRAVLALVGTGAGALGLGMSLADLSRRSVFGVARAQSALPTCVARPEMTEGPYYLDDQLDRSDIRSEPSDGSVVAGVPLTLTFLVSQVASASCTPLPNAVVDVWHCDATGAYSGFRDPRAGFDLRDKTFLRGYQRTDDSGMARFTTIYPGWYSGRSVHIHFKIVTQRSDGREYEFTSQLFFDEDLNTLVHSQPPYDTKGMRDTLNSNDGIYRRGDGDRLLLDAVASDGGNSAVFDVGLTV
ncbi:MAG TPA: intradiol ring-cleavage dioxygenase [Trueperaceae bacterium]|nr:intradiol ring-cleavage dioxygenase [Trueperaceae bacterium]